MIARLIGLTALAFLAGPVASAPLCAQGLEYAVGTTRYKLTTTTKGTQSSPMGTQDFQLDVVQQLTVSLARQAKDTLIETVTVDSVAVNSPQGSQDVGRLIGTKFVSFISPTGRVYSSEPVKGTDPMIGQVAEAVGRFLPSYRRELRSGLSWSDTTTGKVSQQGMELDRTIVSTFKVVGDTAVGGERAFKVERVSNVKAAGGGTTQGTPVSLESTTVSTALLLLSTKGVYLGGRQSDDVSLKITIVAQNAEINIKQQAQTTIDSIR